MCKNKSRFFCKFVSLRVLLNLAIWVLGKFEFFQIIEVYWRCEVESNVCHVKDEVLGRLSIVHYPLDSF